MLESIMQEHPNPNHRKSKLPHLAAAFRDASFSTTPISIYSKDTCSEFHQFFIALLSTYTKIILEIKQRSLSKSPQLSLSFPKFYNIAILLWKVARSQILHIHMRTLYSAQDVVGTILGMPSYESKNVYSNYFKQAQGEMEEAEGEKPKKGEGQGQDDGSEGDDDDDDESSDESDDDESDDGDDNDGDNLDMKELAALPLVYCRWANRLVVYFNSLDT